MLMQALLQHCHNIQKARAGGEDAHEPSEEDMDTWPDTEVHLSALLHTYLSPCKPTYRPYNSEHDRIETFSCPVMHALPAVHPVPGHCHQADGAMASPIYVCPVCRDFEGVQKDNEKAVSEMKTLAESFEKEVTEEGELEPSARCACFGSSCHSLLTLQTSCKG